MNHPRLVVASVLSSLCLAVSVLAAPTVVVPFQAPPPGLTVQDELVVVLGPGLRVGLQVTADAKGRPRVNAPGLQLVLDNLGVERFQRQFRGARPQAAGSRFPDLTGYYKAKLPADGTTLEEAKAAFEALPGVDHVETIGIEPVLATPNDTYYPAGADSSFPFSQWHYRNPAGMDVNLAWDTETGDSSVVVGILDSGVRYFHVDLGGNHALWGPDSVATGGNIWINPGEIAGNGIDDDGNGYVDDTIGWDFVASAGGAGVQCLDQDCSGVDNDPDDGVGHGTHVAGTVAAITNNARSVAGVAGGFADGTPSGTANGVRLMCLRIGYLGRYSGQTGGLVRMDYAAEAMNYVADQVDAGVNVTAINCSWGSSNSGGLGAAVANLVAHDVLIVHAAGNSNSSAADYLGTATGVMNVAATDSNGAGASFSNYGNWVDVAAPGDVILSTYANPDDPDLTHHYVAVLSGTSMSTPHVVGVAALLESYKPSLSAGDKFDILVNTTTPYNDMRDLGSGIVNANAALNSIQPTGIGDLPDARSGFLRAFPNPFRSATSLVVKSPARQAARVQVVDVEGRLVRRLFAGTLEAGDTIFRWDGRDAAGRPAPGGIYFLTVRGQRGSAARKLVRVP